MVKKSEIIVEQFVQGITIRWKDVDGEERKSKALAITGTECGVIGREVWKDVSEILCGTPSDKVRVRIECEEING